MIYTDQLSICHNDSLTPGGIRLRCVPDLDQKMLLSSSGSLASVVVKRLIEREKAGMAPDGSENGSLCF